MGFYDAASFLCPRDIIGFYCFKYHFFRHHWSLLIFCHFGESTKSETRTPCMLLLDSLEKANPRQLESDIRKYVPQQRNGEECSSFVLYFINLFMESAPEDFSTQHFPYFMKHNWFTPEGLKKFCEKIESLKEKSDVDELLF
ncbi:putative ubiquitin-like-specific protease 2b [Quercus suber]|uniref:Ubiquitin-like-specific protease 2b n=1 Tax=Quercus suber TaxID=58331 RepID=A0AAW0JEU8_QUESU